MAFTREQAIAELKRREALKQAQQRQQGDRTNFTLDKIAPELNRRAAALPPEPESNYLGAGTRGLVKGIGAIPDLLAVPSNLGLAYSGQEPLPSVSEGAGDLFDYLTGDKYKPKTLGEKAIGTGAEFLSGGGAIAGSAATKASSAAQKYLAPQALKDYVALGGAGAGLEAGKEIAPDSATIQIGTSVLGSFAPGAAGRVAKGALNPGRVIGNKLGVNPKSYQAFKDADLTPTLADISDSRFTKGAQNILVETPLASTPIEKSIANTKAQISKYQEGLPQIEAGEVAQTGLRNWQRKAQEVASKLQSNMKQYTAPNESIPINNTIQNIKSKPSFSTPEAQKQFNSSSVGKEYNKLLSVAEKNGGTVPYDDLVYFRQQIDDQINSFGIQGLDKEQGALKQLRTQMQKDVGDAFKAKGEKAAKAFERHNKFYTQYAKKNEELVNKLLRNKTATETFKSITSDLRVDAKKADAVLKSLKPDEKEIFSKSLIRELGMSPQNEFNPSNLATNFKKLEPQAQKVVLSSFDDAAKKQFQATIDAIDLTKSTKAAGNPSGTFNQGLKLGTFAAAISNPVGTAGALGAGRVTANLMTSPKFVKWLGESAKITDPAEVAKHTSKLLTISKTSPQLAPDIQRLLSSMENQEQPQQESIEEEVIQEPSATPRFTREQAIQELERRRGLEQQTDIQGTINSSANSAGLSPEFVSKVAQVESNFNPVARNPNSSASGLFQFTNGTWKDVVKKYGKDYGIDIRDKNNPQANAQMASLFLRDNAKNLSGSLGRQPTEGEIYSSHVLGLGGAKKLLKNYGSGKSAVALFPREAKANRSIFYKNNRPITVEELYGFFENKMSA